MFLDFLTKTENENIDKYWEFIDDFGKNVFKKLKVDSDYYTYKNKGILDFFSARVYREYIIKYISKKYTINEFYKYEKMLNKILWYLIDLTKCDVTKIIEINKTKDIKDIVTDNTMSWITKTNDIVEENSMSYINKKYMYNELDEYYYYSKYYTEHREIKENKNDNYEKYKNILYIILNKNIFYKIIERQIKFNEIENKLPILLYPYDYPFPNVTFYFKNTNSKKRCLNRIKKYYYNENDEYWYKRIL